MYKKIFEFFDGASRVMCNQIFRLMARICPINVSNHPRTNIYVENMKSAYFISLCTNIAQQMGDDDKNKPSQWS